MGVLRERDAARGGEPALKLLVRLGNADDLARVAALLTVPEDPQRNAAASALAESSAGAGLLIEAAANDPRLFGPASRAIINHATEPDSIRRLAGLPVLETAVRDAAIVELGSRIRAEELAAGVGAAGLSASVRETILARLAEADRERTPGVVDGLLMLAEARIELRRPAEALAVLRTIDPALLGESQARQHARLRLIGAVLAGDLNAAIAVEPRSLDDWLAAWRFLPEPSDLRRATAEVILQRFGDQLTEPVRAELGQAAPVPVEPTATPPDADGGTTDAIKPETDAGL
jgi:hypothetical protein